MLLHQRRLPLRLPEPLKAVEDLARHRATPPAPTGDTVVDHPKARLSRHDKGTIGTAMAMVPTKAESGDQDFAAPDFRSKCGSPTFTVLRLSFFT